MFEITMTEVKSQTPFLSIPDWGMDWAAYESACRYLGLSPAPTLHNKMARYLLLTAANQTAPAGFGRWLAELRPGRLSLGFLDVWTRLLMPSHPWRFRLNAILALHECDPRGYREMMAQQESRIGTWLSFAHISATAFMNLIMGGAWLCGQVCAYAATGRGLRRERAYFDGKTVLVTGATRGLGLALSARLLSLGANVVAVARASSGLDALRSQIADAGLEKRFRIATADVAMHGAMAEALAEIGVDAGHIDVVVINAGIKENSSETHAEEVIRRIFAVNFFAAVDTVSSMLPSWRTRGSGHFIYISSLGRWHGMTKTGAYNASKAALSVLAESIAMDMRSTGCSGIKTTLVDTEQQIKTSGQLYKELEAKS